MICEVYCLTSFSDQTFYVQVYDDREYILLFAKPFLHTPHGISSVSVPFSTIVEAEKHQAFCGDIYCGLKRVPKSDATINMLKDCLPTTSEIVPEPGITIDGITTIVINHCSSKPLVLYFRNESAFDLNSYSPENVHFLLNLYAHIEKKIGNLTHSAK